MPTRLLGANKVYSIPVAPVMVTLELAKLSDHLINLLDSLGTLRSPSFPFIAFEQFSLYIEIRPFSYNSSSPRIVS